VISVAFKTPLKTRLETSIYKTLLLNRLGDDIIFTPNCHPHILQQPCAHGISHVSRMSLERLTRQSVLAKPAGMLARYRPRI